MGSVLWDVQADDGQRRLAFECPGCKIGHMYTVPRWSWNGSMDKPTFTPSLLNTWDFGPERTPKKCHLFVTDGEIKFLSDCTHELAGQTVKMEDVSGGTESDD